MNIEVTKLALDALEAQQSATGEQVMDVRCEGCGYMTHHREHMGCVRAAKQHRSSPSVPMAYEQIKAEFQRKQYELSEKGASANCPTDLIDFTVGIRFAEAHHGITAQAKKEGA